MRLLFHGVGELLPCIHDRTSRVKSSNLVVRRALSILTCAVAHHDVTEAPLYEEPESCVTATAIPVNAVSTFWAVIIDIDTVVPIAVAGIQSDIRRPVSCSDAPTSISARSAAPNGAPSVYANAIRSVTAGQTIGYGAVGASDNALTSRKVPRRRATDNRAARIGEYAPSTEVAAGSAIDKGDVRGADKTSVAVYGCNAVADLGAVGQEEADVVTSRNASIYKRAVAHSQSGRTSIFRQLQIFSEGDSRRGLYASATPTSNTAVADAKTRLGHRDVDPAGSAAATEKGKAVQVERNVICPDTDAVFAWRCRDVLDEIVGTGCCDDKTARCIAGRARCANNGPGLHLIKSLHRTFLSAFLAFREGISSSRQKHVVSRSG